VDLRRTVRRLIGPDLRDDLGTALAPWLVSRGLVAVAYAVARLAAGEFEADPVPLSLGLFAWDGAWYRGIAEVGYAGLPEAAMRFFPLYPIAGRVVGFVLAGREWLGLVVVANLAALAAGAALRRLVLTVTGDRVAAARAVWLMFLWPAGFVLVWSYSESLFLLAAIAAYVALRRGGFWWAAAFGAAAALTRPVGVLLAVVALVEVLRRRGPGSLPARAAAVIGPVAGLAAFLAWARRATGDGLAPVDAQSELRGDLVFPLTRIVRGIGEVFDGELEASLHVAAALVFAALVVVAFVRLPLSLAILSAAMFVVATSAEHLASLERYSLGAFPVVVAAALVIDRPPLDRAVLHLSAAAMVGLAVLAWLGAYTP
jgi:hypothetical protein